MLEHLLQHQAHWLQSRVRRDFGLNEFLALENDVVIGLEVNDGDVDVEELLLHVIDHRSDVLGSILLLEALDRHLEFENREVSFSDTVLLRQNEARERLVDLSTESFQL